MLLIRIHRIKSGLKHFVLNAGHRFCQLVVCQVRHNAHIACGNGNPASVFGLSARGKNFFLNHFHVVGIVVDSIRTRSKHLPQDALLFRAVEITVNEEVAISQILPHFAGDNSHRTRRHDRVFHEACFPPANPAKVSARTEHVLENSNFQRTTVVIHFCKLTRRCGWAISRQEWQRRSFVSHDQAVAFRHIHTVEGPFKRFVAQNQQQEHGHCHPGSGFQRSDQRVYVHDESP